MPDDVNLSLIPSDHRILLAVQRQVAGLVGEKAGLQAQIDGLVTERDLLRAANAELTADNEHLRAALDAARQQLPLGV